VIEGCISLKELIRDRSGYPELQINEKVGTAEMVVMG